MPSPLRVPYAPLSDAEWAALRPYLPDETRGRPCDHRARFDAIFRLAATDGPWSDLPERYGKPGTISRYFRRLTHAALWERLLIGLSLAPADHPLRRLHGLICRATRRAIRLRGLHLIVLIRRLNLKRALPGPPWMCPDPDLSEIILKLPIRERLSGWRRDKQAARGFIRALKSLHTLVAGRRYIPRALKVS